MFCLKKLKNTFLREIIIQFNFEKFSKTLKQKPNDKCFENIYIPDETKLLNYVMSDHTTNGSLKKSLHESKL